MSELANYHIARVIRAGDIARAKLIIETLVTMVSAGAHIAIQRECRRR